MVAMNVIISLETAQTYREVSEVDRAHMRCTEHLLYLTLWLGERAGREDEASAAWALAAHSFGAISPWARELILGIENHRRDI